MCGCRCGWSGATARSIGRARRPGSTAEGECLHARINSTTACVAKEFEHCAGIDRLSHAAGGKGDDAHNWGTSARVEGCVGSRITVGYLANAASRIIACFPRPMFNQSTPPCTSPSPPPSPLPFSQPSSQPCSQVPCKPSFQIFPHATCKGRAQGVQRGATQQRAAAMPG